ncbi:MAG: adenosylcobinamide-GDP ribazoletransferase [Desulfurivibrionaceae bacterium]
MVNPLRHWALALSFLTIAPLAVSGIIPDDIRRSSTFFPLTGWVIGVVLVLCALGTAAAGMDPLLGGAVLVAIEAWITRGLHLDGVADLCDGLGGGQDPEQRLAIMKDSSTGAFGAVGLVLTLVLKTAGIAVLLDKGLFLFIAFVPAAARWAIVILSWCSTYPRKKGTGHPFVELITGKEVLFGFLGLLLPVFILSPFFRFTFRLPIPTLHFPYHLLPVLLVLFFALLPAFYLRIRGNRLLGGVTGDVLGASCEFGEVLGFAAASVLLI